MFYRLKDGVYLVEGASRGAILDTNAGLVYSVNRTACQIVNAHLVNEAYWRQLVQMGIAETSVSFNTPKIQMNLKFIISKQGLFITALLKNADIAGWVDLQNSLWDKYKLGYQLLQGNSYNVFITENSQNVLEKATEEVKLLMEEGMKSTEFDKLLQNSQDYKKWLENEWLVNKEKVEKELKDILRTDLPTDVFTVYVMGNLVHIGRHLGEHKIVWGHKEDWPNYSLVYLAHEYLHDMFSPTDIEHAVIELATDNELRIRLNGNGEYFNCEGKDVGHDYLRDIEKKIYTNWQEYLVDKKINIKDFIKLHS